jgi:hypothetical protein
LIDVGARQAFLEAKAKKAVAVEAKKAVRGADPDEAFLILKNASRSQRTQAQVVADKLKGVVGMVRQRKNGRLGRTRPWCEESEKREHKQDGGCSAPHYDSR